MKTETTFGIKPVALTVLLFSALALLLAFVYGATQNSVESGIRESAKAVLAGAMDKPPAIGERIILSNAGWSYAWAFRAGKKGGADEGTVYALRITGNSGPYTGIFYRSVKRGTIFCGLAGVRPGTADAGLYGITGRITDMWIARLDRLEMPEAAK